VCELLQGEHTTSATEYLLDYKQDHLLGFQYVTRIVLGMSSGRNWSSGHAFTEGKPRYGRPRTKVGTTHKPDFPEGVLTDIDFRTAVMRESPKWTPLSSLPARWQQLHPKELGASTLATDSGSNNNEIAVTLLAQGVQVQVQAQVILQAQMCVQA
jgi:hypothetical protein